MYYSVERDEPDLSTWASWKFIQIIFDRFYCSFKSTTLNRLRTYINHKQEAWCLRGPNHVLLRCNDVYLTFRSSGLSAKSIRLPLPSKWQKYCFFNLVYLATHVAFPATPPSMNCTNGLMYARHESQRTTPAPPKFTTGIGSPEGCSAKGWTTQPIVTFIFWAICW